MKNPTQMSQYVQTPQPQFPGGQPAPPLPVQQKKSGCLKYILIGVGAFVILAIIGALMSDGKSEATGKAVDPAVTLDQAEANIVSAGAGVAYSNSEAGNALASQFSELFKKAALEGTDTIKDNHDFIVHCQLNDDSVLFLVHVPKLRKFEKESKERFCEIGWSIANLVLATSDFKVGGELAVGVKGLALYQNIYIGTYDPTKLTETTTGVARKTKDTSELEAYFKGAPTE